MDAPILRLDRYGCLKPHNLPQPRVSVEVVRGRARRRVRPIHGPVFLIGTANDCDLVIGDLAFPDAYAYVFVHGTDLSIRRLAAGPDLLVSGEQVESAQLFQGDLIAFGPFELRVSIEQTVFAGEKLGPADQGAECDELYGALSPAVVRFPQVCGTES